MSKIAINIISYFPAYLRCHVHRVVHFLYESVLSSSPYDVSLTTRISKLRPIYARSTQWRALNVFTVKYKKKYS